MVLAITNVVPNTGLTGGREFVLINGTDFNIGVETDGSSKMKVYFGTEEATRVRARSATVMDCLTPIHDPGAVDVKVEDTEAVTEDTLTSGFTYARPVLGGGLNSDLWRVQTVLINELKRQVLDEVVAGSSVDYDDTPADGLNITKIAKTPALVLSGPRVLGADGVHYRAGEAWVETATDVFKRGTAQDVVNLEYTLAGVDEYKIRLTNLLREVISFFRKNPVLNILEDPGDPNSWVEIDMRPPRPQDWRTVLRGNKSSLKFFIGNFTLFGVAIGHDNNFDETRGIDTFNIISSQL